MHACSVSLLSKRLNKVVVVVVFVVVVVVEVAVDDDDDDDDDDDAMAEQIKLGTFGQRSLIVGMFSNILELPSVQK